VTASSPAPLSTIDQSRNLTRIVLRLLSIAMLVIFGIGLSIFFGQVFQLSFAGFIPWVILVASIEALVTYARGQQIEGRERLLFRLSEVVTLAFILRVVLLLAQNFTSIQAELAAMQTGFLGTFFSGKFILLFLLGLFSWWTTAYYADLYDQFHERELDVLWDALGLVHNTLKQIRNRMLGVSVSLLSVLVMCMALASATFSIPGVLDIKAILKTPTWLVTVFGVLLLVQLSLTQFALLRSRWEIDRSKVSPGVPRQWLLSGLILLGVICVVAALLPTEYSTSFFEMVVWLAGIIAQIAQLIISILYLPLFFIFSLFSKQPPQDLPPMPGLEPPKLTPPAGVPLVLPPFLYILRDLLFFGGLIFIIGFGIYQYFSSNSELLKRLRAFPFFSWIARLFHELAGLFRAANQSIQLQIKRLQASGIHLPRIKGGPGRTSPTPTDPREKIIHLYTILVDYAGQHGIQRNHSETPTQYEQKLSARVPAAQTEVTDLTDVFIQARYSPRIMDEFSAKRFSDEIGAVKKTLDDLEEKNNNQQKANE
jgi:uncharacterized membrane protein